MAIVRVHKAQNYTCISNHILRNTEASLKAKGLLTWMISCEDDWDFSIEGMKKVLKEQDTSITSTLHELQKLGYVKVTKLMPESYTNELGEKIVVRSRMEYVYDVQDEPFQDVENQDIESLALEFQDIENQAQRSNNIKEIPNKEIPNKETPAPPVSAKKNHSMVYKETKTLRDDLESGKEVAVQKKERKKQTELDKCVAEIDSEEYGFSEDLKELLRDHLNISFHSKDPKRIKSKGNYQQKLRALKQLISKGNDGIKVVQQSIDRQWNAFYEVKEDYHKKDTRLEGVKAGNESYTKEEIAEMMKTSKVY